MADAMSWVEGKPDPHMIESMRRRNLTWRDILGELIDNSFDAGAKRVVISFGPHKTLSVSDDGRGCLDAGAMLNPGTHVRQETTELGRYGIGLKDAIYGLWCHVLIASVSRGQSMTCEFHPDWVLKYGWGHPRAEIEDSSDPTGTVIRFRSYQRGSPGSFEDLADELSHVFAPALASGRQIIVEHCGSKKRLKQVVCSAPTLPPMDLSITDEFEVDGKKVRLVAGVVKQGVRNMRPGLAILYGHRAIKVGSGIGSEGKSIARVTGTVTLGDGWALTTNKNDLAVEDYESLAPEISHRCRSIFARGMMEARHLQLDILKSEAESRLEGLREALKQQRKPIRDCKERREPGDGRGTHQRGNGKGRRRNVKNVQPGDRVLNAIAEQPAVTIDWVELGEQSPMVHVELMPFRVTFNVDHPWVARVQQDNNADAIEYAAVQMLCDALMEEQGPKDLFPFFRGHSSVRDAITAAMRLIRRDHEQQRVGGVA